MIPVAIFVGAGLGGVARYTLGGWLQAAAGSAFPWGTLAINVSGSILLGFLYTYLDGAPATTAWRMFLGIGFCGGYTTFSAFSYETLRLLQNGEWMRGVIYMISSVSLSVLGALLGYALGSGLRRG